MGTLALVQKGAVDVLLSGCNGIVVAVCGGCSGIVGGGESVFGAKKSNQRMHWMQYTVVTPPYTTIPLHPLCPLHTASTASTDLTFLHQR